MGTVDTTHRGMDVEVGRAFATIALALWLPRMGQVDLYCYAGMGFHGDLKLLAPIGRPWGDVGMFGSLPLLFQIMFVKYFIYISCTCVDDIFFVLVLQMWGR